MARLPTQKEADELLRLAKYYTAGTPFDYPSLGAKLKIELDGENHREKFVLDIRRNRMHLQHHTFQSRIHKSIVLARIDISSRPHRNPDGEEIGSPHIHLYREGYGDKWAYPLPAIFTKEAKFYVTLDEFMTFCNIRVKPHFNFQESLFNHESFSDK